MVFRGIFVTGSSICGGGVKAPRIRTKNLIRLENIAINLLFCLGLQGYALMHCMPMSIGITKCQVNGRCLSKLSLHRITCNSGQMYTFNV